MVIGDVVYIRNKSGLLKILLQKELNIREIARAIGDDKLPEMKHPRLEFHNKSGELMVTLYDESKESKHIYCAFPDYDNVHIFDGVFDDSEQEENIYETIDTRS